MDERQPKRSLTDDPNFLASLSDLDHGLLDDDAPAAPAGNVQTFPSAVPPLRPLAPRPVPRPTPAAITPPAARTPITVAAPPPPLASQSAPTPSAVALPEPPPWLPPTAFAAINAASEALSAAFDSDPSPAVAPPGSIAPPPSAGQPGGTTSPRTLLDLFPPSSSRESTAPSLQIRENVAVPPPIAAAEPPRVAVKPRAAASPTPSRITTYETFYGLDEKPFAPEPDLRFLYHSGAHDKVIQDLVTSVGKRDAVAVLTGPAGIGKTMLCRALVDQLDRRTLVSFVPEAPRSPEALLGTLLVDFGVVSAEDATAGRLASASRADLAGALRDFLSSLAALQASALLIVDDAHKLADPVLHELRTLSDIAAAGKLLQIVLTGEPSLLRQLRSAELRPIDERVVLRTDLGPLEQEEIPGYVAHRLAVAGRGERVGFSEVALRRIFSLSGGVPGVINRLCDRALTLGSKISASQIDGDFVDDAAQQLGLSSADAVAGWRDRMVVALVMLALMLAGAGAAGWVFRAPLSRVLAQWHGAGRSTSPTPR